MEKYTTSTQLKTEKRKKIINNFTLIINTEKKLTLKTTQTNILKKNTKKIEKKWKRHYTNTTKQNMRHKDHARMTLLEKKSNSRAVIYKDRTRSKNHKTSEEPEMNWN